MPNISIEQLERDRALEVGQTNMKFAFAGVGNSGFTFDEIMKISEAHKKRLELFQQISALEKRLELGGGGGVEEALKELYKQEFSLQAESERRSAKTYGETVGLGQAIDRLVKRKYLQPSSYASRTHKALNLKIKPFVPKPYKEFKAFSSLRGFGNIKMKAGAIGNVIKFSDLK